MLLFTKAESILILVIEWEVKNYILLLPSYLTSFQSKQWVYRSSIINSTVHVVVTNMQKIFMLINL